MHAQAPEAIQDGEGSKDEEPKQEETGEGEVEATEKVWDTLSSSQLKYATNMF